MGQLLAIATRREPYATMVTVETTSISCESGLAGDSRGRPGDRQVTVIASEQWDDVCRELGAELDWTLRRANLLLHGVPLREATGRRLRIADALLEITGETVPCQRMDQNYNGLMTALASDWRGGVTCRVIKGGTVTVGDSAAIEDRPATQT